MKVLESDENRKDNLETAIDGLNVLIDDLNDEDIINDLTYQKLLYMEELEEVEQRIENAWQKENQEINFQFERSRI